MTRDEEIRLADYISSTPEEEKVWVAAAKWADEHPKNPWRNAKTDPPK